MDRIGILGGTFDPIHLGHLMLGRQAYEEYKLDAIWFMPSKIPPHKRDRTITRADARCAMVEAAIRPYPDFVLSDFELKRAGGNTYTADTLRLLKAAYPDTEFYFILGADSIRDIEKWYYPEYVLKAVTFLAAERECEEQKRSMDRQIAYLADKYSARILRLHCMEMDVSSAQIRERLAEGEPVDGFLPPEVLSYINETGLYQKGLQGRCPHTGCVPGMPDIQSTRQKGQRK